MKKIMTFVVLAALTQTAAAQTSLEKSKASETRRPACNCQYYRQFVVQDISNGTGFYWLDSTTGHLREFDRSLAEWEDHGIQKGMKPGPKGTYTMLSDNRDGVYVLNTRTGQGWWFDDSQWEHIEQE